MKTAIVGVNWGDEGKGRMVDLFSAEYGIVCRYQGGNNAGHTVVNDKGKFILNLLPSGILRDGVINVMGSGMVIDIAHLVKEMQKLQDKGIIITPDNLKISDKATICMPYHVLQDCLEEERLKDAKFGSTKRGIAPVYGDKYLKKTIRMGDLLKLSQLDSKLAGIIEWKNLLIEKGYGADAVTLEGLKQWLVEYGTPLLPFITDVGVFLDVAVQQDKNIMFEAQLGALRDIDFGIYPYTSSSSTIAAYAPIGAGVPYAKLDKVIGIMKAYATCVGEGPFVAEAFGDEAETLRKAGGEYGAATGRPRRVGGFDIPASKYGVKVQGCSEIALTKLDILSYLDKIPVCDGYILDGVLIREFPIVSDLDKCAPHIIYLDGWKTDISSCTKLEELPENARKYVDFIEQAVQCPITYISVGAGREQYIPVQK
ncbi:MAG: adenylosuccinate synthase [Clostridia bacterium]|nr:adenylosuccinate synthase [Clostridia bacterium]